MRKGMPTQKRRIVWARNILLDVDLHKTTEIELLRQLAKRDYEVFFISAHSRQRYAFQNSKIDMISIPVGRRLSFVSRLIFTVVQVFCFPLSLIKVKPSFVVVDPDSIFGLIPVLPFFRLLGVKAVLDIRSTPTPINNLSKKVGLIQYLQILSFRSSVAIAKKKLDGITIITNSMKEEICSEFRISPNWVGVWPSGVSTESFQQEKYIQNAAGLREQLGLTEKFLICYHGGFAQSRGLIDAIDAMAKVKERYPAVVLFLLGSGTVQTVDEMRKLIQENDLHDRVILHEAVEYGQVPKYIAMCDLGIVPLPNLPQWRYQCPLKLLEYLAMKKVVILSDIPCHREIVGNNRCGIYVGSTRSTELARSIAFAYLNREKLKEWGTTARSIVQSRYTWKRIADDLENYFVRIADQ